MIYFGYTVVFILVKV